MKLKKKKILLSILVVILLLSTIFSVQSIGGTLGEAITDILGTFVGILTWPVRIIALGIAYLMDRITSQIAYLDGGTSSPGKFFTPFEILFNKIRITDIDFFNFDDLNPSCATYKIREAVAQWYFFTRMIAVAASLVVLAYVGVRMSISTMAQDKAKYKKMLVDWASSVALIFLLHYIIIFVLAVNTALVDAIGGGAGAKGEEISAQIGGIATASLGVSVYAIGATIVFVLLVKQTLGLLLAYINRMIKLAFLLIIAPLITITYSIDKMGDNKAQALNAWLKEFIYTILLQPFHCIIYMSLIDIAYGLLAESKIEDEGSLAACVLAYLFIKFLTEAEKLVRKIFGFKDTDTGTTLSSGMAAAGATLAFSKNIGSTIGKGVRFAKGALPGAMSAAGKAADKASNAIGAAATNVRAAGRALANKDVVDKELGINSGEKATGKFRDRMKQQKEALQSAQQAYKNADGKDKDRIRYTRKKVKQAEKKDKALNAGKTFSKEEMAKGRKQRADVVKSDTFKQTAERETQTKREKRERRQTRVKKARGFVTAPIRKVNAVAAKVVNSGVTRALLKGGVATFAGSFNADKSLAAAITAGVGGYKITDEALKYTGGQVKNDLSQKYAAAGIDSAEAAEALYDQNEGYAYSDRVKDDKQDLKKQGDVDRANNANALSQEEVNRVMGEMSRQLSRDASASLQSILDKALGDSQSKMSAAFEAKLRQLYEDQKNANAVQSMGNAFQLGFSERMVFGTADAESTHMTQRAYGQEELSQTDPDRTDATFDDKNFDAEVHKKVDEVVQDFAPEPEVIKETVKEVEHIVERISTSYSTTHLDQSIQELHTLLDKLNESNDPQLNKVKTKVNNKITELEKKQAEDNNNS